MIERVVSTIRSKASCVKFFAEGPSHTSLSEPAMLTQQRAPMRSARANCVRHFSNAAFRVASSMLIGLLQAPTSAMMMSALRAASS